MIPLATTGMAAAASGPWSFHLQDGQPVESAGAGARAHKVSVDPLADNVYVYATFSMGSENPMPYAGAQPSAQPGTAPQPGWVMPESFPPPPTSAPDGQPRGRQFVTLGQLTDGVFSPAVRFGVHDGRSLPADAGAMYAYIQDGEVEHYAPWLRPSTPCDFRIRLNLAAQRLSAWVSGRGDDAWYLVAENTPLIGPVTAISEMRVVQFPDAADIPAVRVRARPWAPGERVQPHPSAKPKRSVGPGRGFRFQSMRSTWGLPGRHVVICRKRGLHFAFPDVVQSDPTTLLCAFSNGSHTGGQGGSSVCISHDLGQSWGEPIPCPGGGRVQILPDGRPVVEGAKAWYASADGGRTWEQAFAFDQVAAGGGSGAPGPLSHIADLGGAGWLLAGSSFPGGNAWTGTEGEQLEFFRSTDRGQTWSFLSKLQPYPPHSICEASILQLPNGDLVCYAREDRNDGFPAVKAFSSDGGASWRLEELPFAMTGRVCAKYLRDGRILCAFRSGIGRSGLWAWVGNADDTTPFLASGAHFNDRRSVGLRRGELHMDNDGACGQFTQYFLRQPDSAETRIDLTAELKVLANAGRAATLCVPFAGQFRVYPDRVEFAQDPAVRAALTPGEFHTIRVVRNADTVELHVDGRLGLKTDKLDKRTEQQPWTPAKTSFYPLAFGNEASGHEAWATPNLMPYHLPADATGYSIWRRVDVVLSDPVTGERTSSWSAERDGFPDQYQLDNILEVDATSAGHDQGYSGWVELPDGRVFVVNYTDDGSPSVKGGSFGVTWITGTYLEPAHLQPMSR